MESVLVALLTCKDAPATSHGVGGRNVLLLLRLSQKDVAGNRRLGAALFGRANKTSVAP